MSIHAASPVAGMPARCGRQYVMVTLTGPAAGTGMGLAMVPTVAGYATAAAAPPFTEYACSAGVVPNTKLSIPPMRVPSGITSVSTSPERIWLLVAPVCSWKSPVEPTARRP